MQTQENNTQTKIVNVANKESATRGVKNIFMLNDEPLFTVGDVLSQTGIKARATLDKYIELGVISPMKKRGPQKASSRGRRFLFRQTAIDKLRAYMSRHGRISPLGIEKVASKPAKKASATKVPTAPKAQRKSISKKSDILAKLDEALERVAYLTSVVDQIAKDHQKEVTGTNNTH